MKQMEPFTSASELLLSLDLPPWASRAVQALGERFPRPFNRRLGTAMAAGVLGAYLEASGMKINPTLLTPGRKRGVMKGFRRAISELSRELPGRPRNGAASWALGYAALVGAPERAALEAAMLATRIGARPREAGILAARLATGASWSELRTKPRRVDAPVHELEPPGPSELISSIYGLELRPVLGPIAPNGGARILVLDSLRVRELTPGVFQYGFRGMEGILAWSGFSP